MFASEDDCGISASKQLFTIYNSKSNPDGYVKVAAARSLTIEYVEVGTRQQTCDISLVVNLQAGKTYSLVGGSQAEPGAIPLLSGTCVRVLGIRDDAANRIVPSRSACSK